MRNTIFLLLAAVLISLTSCRKDFDTVPSTGTLEFSKETVYLDTVFTGISSSTYMLKVYNRSKEDIVIPTIKLGHDDSKYRIMVDGLTGDDGKGKIFSNVELLAKDSLFVFIETTPEIADVNAADFLYTDEIQFYSNGNTQKVNLVTLVQDAVLLYPSRTNGIKENLLLGLDESGEEVRIDGFELSATDPVHGNELHFTNEKPYVIYGYAGVPDGSDLVIDAGARVHFHEASGIVVQPGGRIEINGASSPDPENPLQNEVVFEGDRLEPLYSDIPGQWGTIWLRGTTRNNTINHLTVKNAIVGLLVEGSRLNIDNSQVYDISNVGLLARASEINGTNLVFNTSGQANLACTVGGSYSFKHCTFDNNWPSSNQFGVILTNYATNADGSTEPNPLIKADFFNCIIYGSNRIELLLDKRENDSATPFVYNFDHCLIKFNENGTGIATNPELLALYTPLKDAAAGNIFEQDPKFENISRNKLNIDSASPAVGKANPSYLVPFDVKGNSRTSNDIGAYQSAPF